MYTLYIDTHSNQIVIILYQNEKVKIKKELNSNYDHSINTIPTIIEVLKEAQIEIEQLNEIVVVNGPGSFTGVRIGVTIAKTLAFTLNIPIKAISSLYIKAVSFPHEKIKIVEREKNGVFVGTFNSKNELIGEYKYLKNSEYDLITSEEEYKENVPIDYEKIIENIHTISSQNPHGVNPLYVKKIEVEK